MTTSAIAGAGERVSGELLLGDTVIAGIPIVHDVPPGIDALARLSTPWVPGRVTDAPLRIVHEVGDDRVTGRAIEPPRTEESAYRYVIDAAGAIAVEMDGAVSLVDGPRPIRQRLRTRVPGAEYVLQYSDPADAPLLQWSWQRTVFMDALTGRGRGVVAHGCGFILPSGAGVLAPGVSGAGKSTLAGVLAADVAARVLSDDRLAVTCEHEGLWIWGTPWPSSANLADSADAPLRALVFVRRGGDPVLHELRPVEALRHVLRALALPFWSRTLLDRSLPLVDRLLAETRAFEFAYAPAPGAGEHLARALERRLGEG